MQEGGALFPMQSKKRRQGKRACLLCRQAESRRARSHCIGLLVPPSIRQELHVVNRQQIAATRAGLFRMQSRRRRWRDSQPDNAARPSTARRNRSRNGFVQPSACSARRTMQIRPESRCKGLADSPYIHHAQRIASAIRGHFKRFSGFSVNARRCSAMQSRPPTRS